MPWQQIITDRLANFLRFVLRGALIIDGIAIVSSSVYVIIKVCWFSISYLDRTLFSSPW